VAALTVWDANYDGWKERQAAAELYYNALALRLLLETEKRETMLHCHDTNRGRQSSGRRHANRPTKRTLPGVGAGEGVTDLVNDQKIGARCSCGALEHKLAPDVPPWAAIKRVGSGSRLQIDPNETRNRHSIGTDLSVIDASDGGCPDIHEITARRIHSFHSHYRSAQGDGGSDGSRRKLGNDLVQLRQDLVKGISGVDLPGLALRLEHEDTACDDGHQANDDDAECDFDPRFSAHVNSLCAVRAVGSASPDERLWVVEGNVGSLSRRCCNGSCAAG
jgi:hypothetical protein